MLLGACFHNLFRVLEVAQGHWMGCGSVLAGVLN